MKVKYLILFVLVVAGFIGCNKETSDKPTSTTDQITIDSLIASLYTVKAWDTTTITCYATGIDLVYSWECDHGNFNGGGTQIKYAAGECCVGLNTITCSVSNESGQVTKDIEIDVTSYFGGGK